MPSMNNIVSMHLSMTLRDELIEERLRRSIIKGENKEKFVPALKNLKSVDKNWEKWFDNYWDDVFGSDDFDLFADTQATADFISAINKRADEVVEYLDQLARDEQETLAALRADFLPI